MIKIETETGLHYKVVDFIRKLYPNTRTIAQCGEKQNTTFKRIDSWKNGYLAGQPDIIITDNHLKYKGFCIELNLLIIVTRFPTIKKTI